MMIRHLLMPVLLLASLLLPPASASAANAQVDMRYEGTPALAQLAQGDTGSGLLIYYLRDRGPDAPGLVVRLSKLQGDQDARAEIYEAPAGASAVSLDDIRQGSATPSIVLTALGGWWQRDGRINFNLDIQVSGPIYAMWGGGYDAQRGPTSWTAKMKRGEPAASIQVRDPQGQGLPLWEMRNMLPEFAKSSYTRLNYTERKCDTATTIDQGISPEWPFVAADAGYGYEQTVGVLRPPIVVDWQRSRITHFSELVTARNQNCSYTLYSTTPLQQGALSLPDFETPFAFYDLSGQGVGFPNLIVRAEHYPAGSPWSALISPREQQGQLAPSDVTHMRYSWRDTIGDGAWDYKIDVFGTQPYTETTMIAGSQLPIAAPSYEHLPGWVVGQTWLGATFVDTEGNSYRSSEGIYDMPPTEAGISYLFGWRDTPREGTFQDIGDGFRGEYRLRQAGPTTLYLSPIDNRLHLLGAEGGTWKLGEGVIMRQERMGEGQHINSWVRERLPSQGGAQQPVQEEALYDLGGYLLYSGNGTVVLRKATYEPARFTIAPPSDRQTWKQFQSWMRAYQDQRRDPRDLASWIQPFPGQDVTISKASVADVRLTEQGFRFALIREDGSTASGSLLPALGQQRGSALVAFDGALQTKELPPAQPLVAVQSQGGTQLANVPLAVQFSNNGQRDLGPATLELWGARNGAQPTLLITRTVELLAQQPYTDTLTWSPRQAGSWSITPKLLLADDTEQAFPATDVTIAPVPSIGAGQVLGLGPSAPLFALLAGVIVVAALAVMAIWATGMRAEPETEEGASS